MLCLAKNIIEKKKSREIAFGSFSYFYMYIYNTSSIFFIFKE